MKGPKKVVGFYELNGNPPARRRGMPKPQMSFCVRLQKCYRPRRLRFI